MVIGPLPPDVLPVEGDPPHAWRTSIASSARLLMRDKDAGFFNRLLMKPLLHWMGQTMYTGNQLWQVF
jgi:hypothetical protein